MRLELPVELVGSVASYVGAEESCRTMTRVCKTWRQALVFDSRLWYDFSISAALTNSGPFHSSLERFNNDGGGGDSRPWMTDEVTFAEGVSWGCGERLEFGEADHYELWRQYSIADEEYTAGYLCFMSASESTKKQIQHFLESRVKLETSRICAVAIWLLTTIQFAFLLGGGGELLPPILAGVQGFLGLWWSINWVPFVLRCVVERRFKNWLIRRKRPQLGGFFNSRPPWRRLVHVGEFPGEYRVCQVMRRQESAAALTIACQLLIGRSPAWTASVAASVAVLWYLLLRPRPTSVWRCPVSLAVVGYICLLIIVGCLPFVLRGWSLASVFPLLAPYVVATAALWLETVHDLQPSIDRVCPQTPGPSVRRRCSENLCGLFGCCLCADRGRKCCTVSNAAKLVGIATLWCTGILALLWAEFILYPTTAPIPWHDANALQIVILPLSFNLAILGIAAIAS